MITCQINGTKAIPDASNAIKVTFENPYVKDSGSYTYEISFPMAITENRTLFGNIQRFEVTKIKKSYEDCKLFAGNRLIISGKGTIKSVTNSVVKMQIVGGASRIKYNAKWEKDFIDEIEYDQAIVKKGGAGLQPYDYYTLISSSGEVLRYFRIDMSNTNIIGDPGVFVLTPIYDETNSIIVNNVMKRLFATRMYNLAPQPYLIYILNKVMEHEGFTILRNDFDKEPWNRLVIANTFQTGRIKDALPHWTVYNFIEEFRKLFNATFVFDENKRTVSIESKNELLSHETVSYDCDDEYTCEFDEDGLKNITTNNIEYQLADSANRSWRDVITQSVRKNFPIVDYADFEEMVIAINGITDEKLKRTQIYHTTTDNRYFVFGNSSEDDEGDYGGLYRVGFFSPIIRDMDSDDSIQLKMSPVAMYEKKKKFEDGDEDFKGQYDAFKDKYVYIPSAVNDKQFGLEDVTEDDDGEYYVTVIDAMEGAEVSTKKTDDDTIMQLMFVGNYVRDLAGGVTYQVGKVPSDHQDSIMPITFTDAEANVGWINAGRTTRAPRETASLSLANLPHRGENLPELIDKHNQLTIKFITDDIPDPSKIYLFHGKRYICEKVEMSVTATGVDKVKTGYFYEYL